MMGRLRVKCVKYLKYLMRYKGGNSTSGYQECWNWVRSRPIPPIRAPLTGRLTGMGGVVVSVLRQLLLDLQSTLELNSEEQLGEQLGERVK